MTEMQELTADRTTFLWQFFLGLKLQSLNRQTIGPHKKLSICDVMVCVMGILADYWSIQVEETTPNYR